MVYRLYSIIKVEVSQVNLSVIWFCFFTYGHILKGLNSIYKFNSKMDKLDGMYINYEFINSSYWYPRR